MFKGRSKLTGVHSWKAISQCPHSPRLVRGFGVMGFADPVRAMASMVVRERRMVECMFGILELKKIISIKVLGRRE